MKKTVAILTMAFCAVVQIASAQGEAGGLRTPGEEDILSKILPDDSPYYYSAMMMRYMAGDTSLTQEHYYYLYYGFAYNDAYDAHKELPGEAAMYDILRRGGDLSREDALALIEAGRENMLVDPFSPGNINMMTWAYETVGDTLNMRVSADRFHKIVGAIQSSGTGLREKTPWHILRFSHANDIVAAQGMKILNRQGRSRTVEYIQVDKNPGKVKGYFFNYERVYWNPYEGERVKKGRGWLFNGIPI